MVPNGGVNWSVIAVLPEEPLPLRTVEAERPVTCATGTGVSVTTVFPGEVATAIHEGRRDRLPDWRSNDEERPVEELVEAIIAGVEDDARGVYAPPAVRVLGLSGIAPRLTDQIPTRVRGRSAAPRCD